MNFLKFNLLKQLDGLPKLVTKQLLEPILKHKGVQLIAHEGQFEDLLGKLALHRLDIVLADRPAPNNKNLHLYCEELTKTTIAWYSPKELIKDSKKNFPECLNHLPILLPTSHSTVRTSIDQWFIKNNIVYNQQNDPMLKTNLETTITSMIYDNKDRSIFFTYVNMCFIMD